jgi:hypothetical protein
MALSGHRNPSQGGGEGEGVLMYNMLRIYIIHSVCLLSPPISSIPSRGLGLVASALPTHDAVRNE